jgi:uncharacterized protein (DUF2147 family)
MNKSLQAITYDGGADHIDVEFKEDTSITDPTFILRTQSKVLEGNYIYVPNLNRYYYINDYVVSHQRIYINCHVDVLMSFKNEIKQENVIVKRQERDYNLFISDEKQKFYNTNATVVKEFPKKPFSISKSQFILCLNGASVSNP